VIVPKDAAVFEIIAAWAKAPAETASAAPASSPAPDLPESLGDERVPSSTTPAGCR
jgi:hypothetical protein